PTCGSAQGTTEPTERNFDWTATPHWPASRSQATIEYVEMIGSAIRGLDEVDCEEVLRRHQHAGYFRAGERRQHLLLGVCAHDDGHACLVCCVQLRVVELVEHERLGRELDLALDRQLRDALLRRAEPALSQTNTVPPGSG